MTSHAVGSLTALCFSLTIDGVEIGQFSPAQGPVATPSSRSAKRKGGQSPATTSRMRVRRKIEISGLKAGASEVLYETVTLVCNKIERVDP